MLEAAIDAEREVEIISKRTRNCLQVAKRKGVQLGKNGKKLAVENKQAADDWAVQLHTTIINLQSNGITTIRAMAKELN